MLVLAAIVRRAVEISVLPRGCTVVIHREAFPFATPLGERAVRRRAARVVLDVDDAIYEAPTHVPDWRRFLRRPQNYDSVLALADVVLAGSPALMARASTQQVRSVFAPTLPPRCAENLRRSPSARPSVLWTGSYSTLGSLKLVLDDVLATCEAHNGVLYVLGGENVQSLKPHRCLRAHIWSVERELRVLAEAWVGLMPLADSPWEQGKSAYKLLLYMHAGVPSLVSPVGMNAQIADAAPGVLAVNELAGWSASLDAMLQSPARESEGEAARRWVRAHFDREALARRAASAVLPEISAV
jgi:glycosyltransferase involved in cell wall biosynthesis